LLTQTVEEKSNRVIEVLLSAVSPVELMAGKILGQMAVSTLVLAPSQGADLKVRNFASAVLLTRPPGRSPGRLVLMSPSRHLRR
jgi:hypothetical protein